jgi:hypothetical protein
VQQIAQPESSRRKETRDWLVEGIIVELGMYHVSQSFQANTDVLP